MLSLRGIGACRSAVARLFSAIFMFALMSGFVGMSGKARADDRPFWEQSDPPKSAKTRHKYSTYNKSPSRKYARSGYRKYASQSLTKSHTASKRKKLGGYAAATEPTKHKKGYRVAALGSSGFGNYESKKSLSGGSVRWAASSGCLDGNLKAIIYQVAAHFWSRDRQLDLPQQEP